MSFKMASSPHQHLGRTTAQLMRLVVYCALPGIAMQVWFFGMGVAFQLVLAITTAMLTEAAVLHLRGRDFEPALKDGSALLTAVLLAISIPPLAPWWVVVIGSVFAIAIVKQLYGGLGFNLFNPAMAAYVALLVSFPVQMTSWLPPVTSLLYDVTAADALNVILTGYTQDGYSLEQLRMGADGTTMATPLDGMKTQLTLGYTLSEITGVEAFFTLYQPWLWINLAYLAGGLVLLKQKAIGWQIPVSMLAALAVLATVFFVVDNDRYPSAWFHLSTGATMLGAWFIATDPVSASTTTRGRLWYGAMIGVWVYLIRTFGGYPDALAFAVLIMNMAVPLIDYYTRPTTYGHKRGNAR